jgi:hypothetical protein
MSFAFHRSAKDWLLDPHIMVEAGEAIERDVKIIRTFDVPYVAGYVTNDDTFYIDHAFPRGFENGDEFFDVTPPIIIHEATEHGLLETIPSLPYQLAHQVALHAERAYVEAKGIKWATYNAWCMRQIKIIGDRARYDHCPQHIDLKPYLDEEDWATLKKMFANGKPLWNGKRVHPDVQ